MSDRVMQSYNDSDSMTGEPVYPYQSAWMAHWMRTSCKSATQGCSRLSIHYESKEEEHDSKQHPMLGGRKRVSDVYSKGFREVTEGTTVNIINETLTSSSKNLRGRLDYQPFPMFSLSQKRKGVSASKNNEATIFNGGVMRSQNDANPGHNIVSLDRNQSHLPSKLAWAPSETETPSRECDFKSSSLKLVPYGFNNGRTPFQSFMCREQEVNQSKSIMASEEHSTFLVHEKKIKNLFDSERSGKSLLREKDTDMLLHYPSTSSNHQPYYDGRQCQKMQNHYDAGLFPSQNSLPEVTKLGNLYNGYHSLPGLPCSVRDMETMRICTTVDSVEESSRGPSKLSQTTHRFLIAKETDVNLSEGGQMFRESTVSTKVKGNTFSELLKLSPEFGFHVQQGVKLQPLESSMDSEGKENVRDVNNLVGLRNESSTETDTMDMDALQENHFSGVASSPSNKYLERKSPTSQAANTFAREEVGGGLLNMTSQAANTLASPVDCRETSTSRTQSLDMEHLLSHAEQPVNSKLCGIPDGPLGPEPSSRWVKRLKNASDSAHGTKSSKMDEASSLEKVNKFFNKIMKCGITSSEPTTSRCHGKETVFDQNAMLLMNGESSSVDSVKKSQDVTISHPWIQRWCRNRAASPQKKPEPVVVCEPQGLKATENEFQKKQFPSIAAMALMGKAMSGFHPCEFTKRGSFVVWNSKGIPR